MLKKKAKQTNKNPWHKKVYVLFFWYVPGKSMYFSGVLFFIFKQRQIHFIMTTIPWSFF